MSNLINFVKFPVIYPTAGGIPLKYHNNGGAIVSHYADPINNSFISSISGSWTTVANYTGSGILNYLVWNRYTYNSGTTTGDFELVLDGVSIVSATSDVVYGSVSAYIYKTAFILASQSQGWTGADNTVTASIASYGVAFRNSCIIRHRITGATASTYASIVAYNMIKT